MTQTEIRKRDGLARTGIFIHDNLTVNTPAVLDTTGMFSSLQKMTGSNVPLGAGAEFTKKYFVETGEQPVSIHPALDSAAKSGDCVMVANWHNVLENPRNYVKWLVSLKVKNPPDTVWYAPAAALPSNIHMLVYSGFDLFDFRAVDLRSAQGLFCIAEGEFSKDLLATGTCTCRGCQAGDLKQHNRQALLNELALVTRFIGLGQVRELAESRCRMHAPLVAILRLLDNEYAFMERCVPVARGGVIRMNSGESMTRADVRRFADRVLSRYIPPKSGVAVLLPCSAKKPYSLSWSHRRFQAAIARRAHELIITSPVGLVPRELETMYPAGHYDVPVTGYWDAEETRVIATAIARYFERNRYRRIIAHLDGGAQKVVEMAAEMCGITLEFSCREHPSGEPALMQLDQLLEGEKRLMDDRLHGMCSYQFGIDLESGYFGVRGHFPELYYHSDRTQYFSINTSTGMLRPTFEGWNLIPGGYRVMIDDFIPEGDVLVPGVVEADPQIRQGDEVLVVGPRVMATGTATMPAGEMLDSKRGVAVRVRKVKKL